MTITAEERAAINRQNASKSTGPKTAAGKERVRRNALKHGLRIEALGLPLDGEDAEALQGLADEWTDYYQPASPGEHALIDRAVLATVQLRRGARYQAVALAQQVRGATVAWHLHQSEELIRLSALFWGDDPAAAVRELRRSAAGCARLLELWEPLRASFEARGVWDRVERDTVIRLCGYLPGSFATESTVYRICVFNLGAVAAPDRDALDWMAEPRRIPANVPDRLASNPPAPEVCRDHLRALIDQQETMLRNLRGWLDPIAEADRDEAADRALLLTGPEAALLLRYERMHDSAFHRAYGTLLKVQKERARDDNDDAPNKANAPLETDPEVVGAVPDSRNAEFARRDENVAGQGPPDPIAHAPNKANALGETDPGRVGAVHLPRTAEIAPIADAGGQGIFDRSDDATAEVDRAEQSQFLPLPLPSQLGPVGRSMADRAPVC